LLPTADQYQRAASYIDRILKGEKPADLPVQAPTKYVSTINPRTADALALMCHPPCSLVAYEVIDPQCNPACSRMSLNWDWHALKHLQVHILTLLRQFLEKPVERFREA
jgi:hypothetical protein